MGKTHTEIDDQLAKTIKDQHVFFVATAPLSKDGNLNLSPKGLDSFRILGPRAVAYLDVIGSGVETIAHLKENGRIVLMFCAFDRPPNILRLHGRGRVVEPHSAEFPELAAQFPQYESTRAIIVIEVTRISSSCGFGVPVLRYEGDRDQIFRWARKKGPDGLKTYKQERNRRSIDGLPGLAECSATSRVDCCAINSLGRDDRERIPKLGANMKYGWVVLLLLLFSANSYAKAGQPSTEKAPSAFEQTLFTAEKGFIAAAKKGDVAFFKRTLTDDFSFVAFDGQLYERQDMLDQFGQGGMDLLPYEMKVVSAGDGVAIVTYNVVLRVPPSEDQGPPPRYQHFSTVWVKQGDVWKMKFQQMTAAHWGDW